MLTYSDVIAILCFGDSIELADIGLDRLSEDYSVAHTYKVRPI